MTYNYAIYIDRAYNIREGYIIAAKPSSTNSRNARIKTYSKV